MSPKAGRVSLVEEVTQSLLEQLAKGEYQPEARMPSEQELSEEFNVSRSCIREAMRSLEMLNLVEIRHGTGAFVKQAQPDFLIDPKWLQAFVNRKTVISLLELGKIIAVQSAALAANRATKEEIEILERDVQALEVGVSQHRRPDEELGFHLDVARATHNPAIVNISRWVIAVYAADPLIPNEQDVAAHRQIFEAIRDGKQNKARKAMREHLEDTENHFRKLAKKEEGNAGDLPQ